AMLAGACANKTTSLKAALSDQKVVAGLGNIYVCEALHRALLSPKRSAATLAGRAGKPTPRAEKLVTAIKDVLHDAIKAGGSSLRDHPRTDGELGDLQHNFRVSARAGPPPRGAAAARSSASCRPGGRPSSARCASGRRLASALTRCPVAARLAGWMTARPALPATGIWPRRLPQLRASARMASRFTTR